MQKTRVGSVEVIALVDNIQLYPATAVYPQAGDALAQYSHHFDDEGRVALNFGCFVCIDSDMRLLVDTGWGPEYQGRLLDELAEAEVELPSVTHVLSPTFTVTTQAGTSTARAGGRSSRMRRTSFPSGTGTTTARSRRSPSRSCATWSRCRR
jgi:hypothetical protein